MYISGVPGTGKTATFYEVLKALNKTDGLPSFKFIEINGLKIGDPNQFYSQFLLVCRIRWGFLLKCFEFSSDRN